MSSTSLAQRFIFGLKVNVEPSAVYVDESTIAYVVGVNVVLFNTESKSQRYLNVIEQPNASVTALAANPANKLLAVAIKSDKPSIAIFDLQVMKRRKVMSLGEGSVKVTVSNDLFDINNKEFVSLAFSADAKFLASQSGSPDWTSTFWSCERGKPLASWKASSQTISADATATRVSFNPNDSSHICVTGFCTMRFFRYLDNQLKPVASRHETKNYVGHTWTPDERCVVATEDSKLLIFIQNELVSEITVTSGPNQVLSTINAIAAFSKGVACATGTGYVCIFSDEGEEYAKVKEYSVAADSNTRVSNFSLNPTQETMACVLENSHLYQLNFGSIDIIKNEDTKFDLVSVPFHYGSILGMDACIRKPLLVTCGVDKAVKIWNYRDYMVELSKTFTDDVLSVAIHPSGLYVLAGFSDKLRLMNLFIDDLRTLKEFSIRNCREVRFSNGGQYFAAANGNIVQIYDTWSFENLASLRGHEGRIRSLVWSANDVTLVSSAADGSVYEWSIRSMRRISDHILKSCNYNCAVPLGDGKTIVAVGSDKSIKEISESQVIGDHQGDVMGTQLVVLPGLKTLAVGMNDGSVALMKYPLDPVRNPKSTFPAHSGGIMRMLKSHDDQFLFTASDDGSLFIFQVEVVGDTAQVRKDFDVAYAEEVLVSRSDLEAKINSLKDLKTRVDEQKMEHEYQLRVKDMGYHDKMMAVSEKYGKELEDLKAQNSILLQEKEIEELRHKKAVDIEKERHQKDMEQMEIDYTTKLSAEYEKYQQLEVRASEVRKDWEAQLAEMDAAREAALSDLIDHYEKKLNDKQQEIDALQEEMRRQIKEFEEITKEAEEDADREVLELKLQYDKKLQEEKETSLRLKGENGVMKKKFLTLQSEIENQKTEIQRLMTEEKRLQNVIKGLEKDILSLRKEVQERDDTIQDKEKRIYDLKKKNQELEKFRFVLDYKIQELKHQIEPREHEIEELGKQIGNMDEELEQYHRINIDLDQTLADLRFKVKTAEKELNKEKEQVKIAGNIVKRFKIDLTDCIQHVEEPRKFKKYCKNSSQVSEHDKDFQVEFRRQRAHLEYTIASLRQKFEKDQVAHRIENGRMIEENLSVIREINEIRRQLNIKSDKLASVQ